VRRKGKGKRQKKEDEGQPQGEKTYRVWHKTGSNSISKEKKNTKNGRINHHHHENKPQQHLRREANTKPGTKNKLNPKLTPKEQQPPTNKTSNQRKRHNNKRSS